MEYTYDNFVLLLQETEHGQLVDSFFAIELGRDSCRAWWDSFIDIAMLETAPLPPMPELATQFAFELNHLADLSEIEFDKLIGSTLGDA